MSDVSGERMPTLFEPTLAGRQVAASLAAPTPRLKVLMVSQPRDPLVGQGSEHGSVAIVTRALADRLADRCDLHVVAPRADGQHALERSVAGVTIHRVAARGRFFYRAMELVQGIAGRGLPVFARRSYYAGYVRAVCALIRELRPDVVHLMTYPQFAPAIRRAAPDARLVLHLHDEALLRLPRDLAQQRLARFDAVCACSNWLAGRLSEAFPTLATRIRALGNGVDIATFRLDTEEARDAAPRLLFVGRVSPEKGPHVLIDAFTRLAGRHPRLELVMAGPVALLPYSYVQLIAGDPPMRSALAFYGADLMTRVLRQVVRGRSSLQDALRTMVPPALRDRVAWLGSVPHHTIARLMSLGTIFVQPSLCEEGFGLPLAEAMACGLAVVGSRRGGITEMIEHGRTGLLVDASDPEALASAVERLLDDPAEAKAMGRAAAEKIARTHSWDTVAERLWSIWTKAAVEPCHRPATEAVRAELC